MQERRPEWYPLDRPASIEEDLVPLAVLHEILRRVGLARLASGVLRPTRAAADDQEVVRRLRTWFEPEGFRGILGGVAVAVLAVSGPLPSAELVRRVVPLMGHGWAVEGRPLTDADYRRMLHEVSAELRALDLLAGTGGRGRRARRPAPCFRGRRRWRTCGRASRPGDGGGPARPGS